VATQRSTGFKRFPTERARVWLDRYLIDAATDPAIMAVIAIGSSVRPSVESIDLDLVVATAGSFQRIIAPIEIDIRQYHIADLENKLTQGNDLLGWAVRYGVVLTEKCAYWSSIVDRHRDSLPFPSATQAKSRAARAMQYLESVMQIGDDDAAAEQLLSHLTHLSRAELIERGVYPISRPELPDQLRGVGEIQLADLLEGAINRSRSVSEIYADLHTIHS
jgi:hypothetical protein